MGGTFFDYSDEVGLLIQRSGILTTFASMYLYGGFLLKNRQGAEYCFLMIHHYTIVAMLDI